MGSISGKTAAIIVAHPDDETLWAGGTMLLNQFHSWFTLCMCRGSDPDRAPKFFKALKMLGSEGIMGLFTQAHTLYSPHSAPCRQD